MTPVKIGDRIVVYGIDYAHAHVKNVTWSQDNARWEIELDWGCFGSSIVFDNDENIVWYKYANVN